MYGGSLVYFFDHRLYNAINSTKNTTINTPILQKSDHTPPRFRHSDRRLFKHKINFIGRLNTYLSTKPELMLAAPQKQ